MSVVQGMLLMNGLIELSFGLIGAYDNEHFLHRLSFPGMHGTHAVHLWYAAVIALGVMCLHGFYNVSKHRDTRYGSTPLLAMITYHIFIIYYTFGQVLYNAAALKQPEHIYHLTIPGILENYVMTPYDFCVNGVGAHCSLLVLTMLAFFCVEGQSEAEKEAVMMKQYQQRIEQREKQQQQQQQMTTKQKAKKAD